MENGIEKVDALLVKPCYIMDFLPEQVEPDNGGQFFDVEYYLLNSDKYIGLRDRFVSVILKLMCYYHVAILWNGWVDRPSPKIIEEAVCEIMENHSGTDSASAAKTAGRFPAAQSHIFMRRTHCRRQGKR